jgi:hypothetical protein
MVLRAVLGEDERRGRVETILIIQRRLDGVSLFLQSVPAVEKVCRKSSLLELETGRISLVNDRPRLPRGMVTVWSLNLLSPAWRSLRIKLPTCYP